MFLDLVSLVAERMELGVMGRSGDWDLGFFRDLTWRPFSSSMAVLFAASSGFWTNSVFNAAGVAGWIVMFGLSPSVAISRTSSS
jgi:hypothetical protein